VKTDAERSARIQSAIDWLNENASKAAYPEPWISRANVLKMYFRKSIELGEDFIVNGDNFLDAGWKDPFK
jgi:hypothetical protein